MSLFMLADGTHAGFDKHRARFFWEGVGDKRKYHWVNWVEVCKPKDQGGLGVMNTKLMNISLMVKWIWRLFAEQPESSLWHRIISAKYPGAGNIFTASARHGSPFWRSLHKIKDFFKLGARYSLGNGEKIQFWTDWWVGDGPLAQRFSRLFQISAEPNASVSQLWRNGAWNIHFRRSFGPSERENWVTLLGELSAFLPSAGQDSVSWALEPSGRFSTKSLYQKLIQGATVAHAKDIWKIACPLKVRIFIWQLARGRLPANDQIRHRHGPSDGLCKLCHSTEDVQHIFFNCPMARFAWSVLRDVFEVDWDPSSFADLFAIFQRFSGQFRCILWLTFAAQSWALWLSRNKFTIEGKFPGRPTNCVFKTILFLQLWRPLQKSKVLPQLDGLVAKFKETLARSNA
jgi:hypothetical protein